MRSLLFHGPHNRQSSHPAPAAWQQSFLPLEDSNGNLSSYPFIESREIKVTNKPPNDVKFVNCEAFLTKSPDCFFFHFIKQILPTNDRSSWRFFYCILGFSPLENFHSFPLIIIISRYIYFLVSIVTQFNIIANYCFWAYILGFRLFCINPVHIVHYLWFFKLHFSLFFFFLRSMMKIQRWGF